jgi:hypothetical protein
MTYKSGSTSQHCIHDFFSEINYNQMKLRHVCHKTSESKGRAQSNPRTRPGWTYSRGAAMSSHSSMYKCISKVMMFVTHWKKRYLRYRCQLHD